MGIALGRDAYRLFRESFEIRMEQAALNRKLQAALEQGTLIPLSGLDNPELGLKAKPAQVWRLRLAYGF